MGRSHSKHKREEGSGGIDTGKNKDSKAQSKPEQNAHAHHGTHGQASTSKPARKSLPHSNYIEAFADKPGKKKRVIPKIVVSGPSNEELTTIVDELPETKTIRDTEDYGPYTVHSRPSTIDAYRTNRGEHERADQSVSQAYGDRHH